MPITKRLIKGSALSFAEMDENFAAAEGGRGGLTGGTPLIPYFGTSFEVVAADKIDALICAAGGTGGSGGSFGAGASVGGSGGDGGFGAAKFTMNTAGTISISGNLAAGSTATISLIFTPTGESAANMLTATAGATGSASGVATSGADGVSRIYEDSDWAVDLSNTQLDADGNANGSFYDFSGEFTISTVLGGSQAGATSGQMRVHHGSAKQSKGGVGGRPGFQYYVGEQDVVIGQTGGLAGGAPHVSVSLI